MSIPLEIHSTAVLGGSQIGDATAETEVIAGYTLEKQIGVGGFGEVWKALGPGGLPKAVKILFGKVDGPQADAELKSLERVRELRHPFLLNIERIEACNGRLIVVSELADGSLEDRFEEAKQSGLRGIPRDKLLAYLRDAADALDFMFEKHGLQHLDIKPENLLVQGDHAKVGDFGLIKDVKNSAVSLVGGFTPLYAPPEIFEGRPSDASDQYSLAIVYQIMLTGVPPFGGRTAAQLTAQHLRSTPDLSALQPVDRPVIARALSKNPHSRFQSCRQFVDALTKRRNSRTQPSAQQAAPKDARGKISKTLMVNPSTMTAAEKLPVLKTTPIAPLADRDTQTPHRPTIFIGLGGLGGQVLCSLRQRFSDQFGDAALPSFPLLYIDTDSRSIVAVRPEGERAGLSERETACIPLRSSSEFRTAKNVHRSWLSRRWLYNIPKSGQVEGIRPLGRLALVDHQRTVRERLREIVSCAIADDSVRETAQGTQLAMENGPLDVVLVASTSGGTSSGSALDAAFLIREVCMDLEVEIGSLVGVLMHVTGVVRQQTDVQEANTISFLSELQHFCTPGLGGPRGMSKHAATEESAPFNHAYIVSLGNGLGGREFARKASQVGDYLYANAATPGRAHFQHWRDTERQANETGESMLRTFGLASIDETYYETVSTETPHLCRAVIRKWIDGSTSDADSSDQQTLADRDETRTLLSDLNLTNEKVAARVVGVLQGVVGKKIAACSRTLWNELASQTGAQEPDRDLFFRRLAETLSSQADGDRPEADTLQAVIQPVSDQVTDTTPNVANAIKEHIFHLLDGPDRLHGASQALSDVQHELDTALEGCSRLLEEITRTAEHLRAGQVETDGEQPVSPQKLRTQCHEYCVLHCSQAVCRSMILHVTEVRKLTDEIAARLLSLRTRVIAISKQFSDPRDFSPSNSGLLSAAAIDDFDSHLQTNDQFRLADLLESDEDDSAACSALIRESTDFLQASGVSPENRPANPGTRVNGFPQAAHPVLTSIGGGRRVLAVLPESVAFESWSEKLVDEFGDCVTVRKTADDQLTVYCEVEGVAFETVLAQFTQHNPYLVEVAERVHTRNDIEW